MPRASKSREVSFDHEVDFLVVGSGAGGLTAALAAAANGLNTLVIEKADVYGGTTALSGGNIWVPNNPTLIREGLSDSRDDVRAYMRAVVGDGVPEDNIDAFVDEGPRVFEFLEKTSPLMRFQWCTGYSDYHPEKPGGRPRGRTIEPLPFDLKMLGTDESGLRPGALPTPAGLYITSKEFVKLNMVMRTWAGRRAALATGWRAAKSVLTRRHMETLGQALVGRLRLAIKQAGVPLWLNTAMESLITDDDDCVVGVVAERNGRTVRIRASKGVLLACGGFEQSDEMRRQYLPENASANYSLGSVDNTGDGIRAGQQIGAAVNLMDDAWWMPSFKRPDGIMHGLVSERSVPRSIIVNQNGVRFTNESAPYVTFVHNQIAGGHDPAWFIFDAKAKSRYQIGAIMPGQKFPKSWFDNELLYTGDTLDELAGRLGLPKKQLALTVHRYNRFAHNGVDEDFERGKSAYDNYYGDPTLPVPSMDMIDEGPYYAIRLRTGDLGTKGGLVYNKHAQVMHCSGEPIAGLYATGNTSSAVMGNDYAGAGATIGPAMVFGYIAARHAADRRQDPR
ncbi:FAD-dependent oxidoreductase [Rhodococcus qingshengii]|uniref:FAD-dependent oxidoreductase n=1 Tax=Rhodococcus qingshengii TaxID=334542 RepID=UPI001C8B6C8A|nr:FAD-dependent oxidoreductase [Rhodococcus qingshengii]MBX9150960.1 FAD-dependent oxidoreductase [Rhodococcus qingshengii]